MSIDMDAYEQAKQRSIQLSQVPWLNGLRLLHITCLQYNSRVYGFERTPVVVCYRHCSGFQTSGSIVDDRLNLDVHAISELQKQGFKPTNDLPKYSYSAADNGRYCK